MTRKKTFLNGVLINSRGRTLGLHIDAKGPGAESPKMRKTEHLSSRLFKFEIYGHIQHPKNTKTKSEPVLGVLNEP